MATVRRKHKRIVTPSPDVGEFCVEVYSDKREPELIETKFFKDFSAAYDFADKHKNYDMYRYSGWELTSSRRANMGWDKK